MNCKNCGTPLSDDAVFCGVCGARVEKEVENQVSAETEVFVEQQDIAAEAPAFEAPVADNFAQVQFDAPEATNAKKKGKGWVKALIPIVAVVAAVAVVFAFFGDAAVGTAIKTFGSPSDYLTYVEARSLGGYVDSITNMYDTYLVQGMKMDQYAEAKLDVELGESALELLEQAADMDLEWLNDLGIKMNANVKDTAESVNMALTMGEQSILSMDVIMDMANAGLYVAIPELNDKYLYMEMDDVSSDMSGMSGAAGETMEDLGKTFDMLEKILPSEKSVNSLVDKYIKIALENLEEVEKDSEAVEVDDIEQKLTTLEFEFTQETAVNIAIAVLEELKEDSEVKKIVENAQNVLVEEDFIDEPDDSAYDVMVDAIDDALDDLEDADPSDDELFTLVDYVNSKHEVVGRAIEVSGTEILRYVTVYKGSNFATELVVEQGLFELLGTGTEKGGVINGEFNLTVQDTDVLTMTVENFDSDKAEEGYFNGKFKLEPSSALLEELGASVVSAMNPAIEIVCESSESSSNIAINVLTGDELFAGITVSDVRKAGQEINVPAESETVDADDAEEWMNSLSFDKLIENLKKTDIPDDIVDALETLMDGGLDSILYGSSGSYDDYYSDSYYDDYYSDSGYGYY